MQPVSCAAARALIKAFSPKVDPVSWGSKPSGARLNEICDRLWSSRAFSSLSLPGLPLASTILVTVFVISGASTHVLAMHPDDVRDLRDGLRDSVELVYIDYVQ